MKTTLYITRTGDMIRFGRPSDVTLDEYPHISRAWTRRVSVDLPDEYKVARSMDGIRRIYRGRECCHLAADEQGNPEILDFERGHISLAVLAEGWDQEVAE